MWALIRDSCSTDVSAEAQYVSRWKYITTGQNWFFWGKIGVKLNFWLFIL